MKKKAAKLVAIAAGAKINQGLSNPKFITPADTFKPVGALASEVMAALLVKSKRAA